MSVPARRSGRINYETRISANDPLIDGSTDRWFDVGAFALPEPFTFGNAPRNSVTGPGLATVDLALSKSWRDAVSRHLEIRWEVFNVLNRSNFDIPSRVFGTPNFARIFSAKSAREMQFGVRLGF
jgi:hypothetical protein